MAQVTLRAQSGRSAGSRVSGRIRRGGQVPAIVYGKGITAINVTVDHHDLVQALHTESGLNALINLEIEDGGEMLTLARQVQRHPFRNQIRHVDFVRVDLSETVEGEVPLHFIGVAAGTKDGGIFAASHSTVAVEAVATNIPNFIEVSISELRLGDVLRVSDLPVLEGVRYVEEPDEVLATVSVIVEKVEEPVVALPVEGEVPPEEAAAASE